MPYLMHHKLEVTAFLILLALLSYALSRAILRHRPPSNS